jgi:hypothetical protein
VGNGKNKVIAEAQRSWNNFVGVISSFIYLDLIILIGLT